MPEEVAALWIKDPLAIFAERAERGILVRGSRIIELVPGGGAPVTPDFAVYDASEHVVLPGLINTHHHFFQTLTRAIPAALDRELFAWLRVLYPIWARLTPERLELAVTLAMAELLLSGCTMTTDHHYVFPADLEHAIDIEAAAAKRLGMRVLLTRGSMNLSQRDGGLPPDDVVQDEDTILADSERLVTRYHEVGDGAMIQIGVPAAARLLWRQRSQPQGRAALGDKRFGGLHRPDRYRRDRHWQNGRSCPVQAR